MKIHFEDIAGPIALATVLTIASCCITTGLKTENKIRTLTDYIEETDNVMNVYIDGVDEGTMTIAPDDITNKYTISDINTDSDTLYLKTKP